MLTMHTQTPNYRVEADNINLIAQMYHGRAKKATWRYRFKSLEQMNNYIAAEIAKHSVRQTGWASDEVVPAVDKFIGEPETVRLNQWGGINRRCGTASLTDTKQKHHRSWYA